MLFNLSWLQFVNTDVLAMTITGSWPATYDPDFACCGGCSSSKRADAYNNKLATGARVFIWDVKVKTNPQPVCYNTFPYDPALNEQIGDRRVRSGRLVGTNYPIDNDYDYLCCQQRGECLALDEDASGQCRCVKRWGFTGEHCQYSVYDVAEVVNAKVFPNATNFSSVDHMLPDLRKYLLKFDYGTAIESATATNVSPGDLLDALQAGSYRQFGWSSAAYFIAAAVIFMFIFFLHVMWTFCLFKCGCRRRNPLAKPKIYSRLQKMVWGTLMTVALVISASASLAAITIVFEELEPLVSSAFKLMNTTLQTNLTVFETTFLSPMDQLVANGYQLSNGSALSLTRIQEKAQQDLEMHTFLDNQSYAEDVIGQPIFALLEPLANYSTLFPTVNDASINCETMNITQVSVSSRMTIGGATGCFKCKTCLTISDLVADAKTSWRKNIFEVQMDMITAKNDLRTFSLSKEELIPLIQNFLDRMHRMCTNFRTANKQLADGYNAIAGELQQISQLGLFALCGLCGFSILLALSAFVYGLKTGKRRLGRTTCLFTEIAFLVALIITGALYASSFMVYDAIVVLQRVNADSDIFFPTTQSAEDASRLLYDDNLVEAAGMLKALEFSDTLRVPPHPTPSNDTPARFNFATLYGMPSLFTLENLTSYTDEALIELFEWDESFVSLHYQKLKMLAFVNDTYPSPYNGTQYQLLLNSTVEHLIDPDGDGHLVTTNDQLKIHTIFNESWRGVSDEGYAQNVAIQTEWLFVAQLYYQKQRLQYYAANISSIIGQIHAPLNDLIQKSEAMEAAEFQLKAPVEFVTDSIHASRIADCHYNGNCGWFRQVLNELFSTLQQLVTKTELAVISCAISVFALFLSMLFTNAFTNTMRRNVVKVYVSG